MFVGRVLVYVCHINPNESSTIDGKQGGGGGERQKKEMKEELSMVLRAFFVESLAFQTGSRGQQDRGWQ